MEGKKHLILFFVVALICFGMAVMCRFSKLHGFHLFLCVCVLQSVLCVGIVIHVLINEGSLVHSWGDCGNLTLSNTANLTEQTLFQKEMNKE